MSECLPDAVLRKSEWYNDFVLCCGVSDILGARLVETPSHFATFGFHQQIGRRFADKTAAILEVVAGPLGSATIRHIDRLFGLTPAETESDMIADGGRYYFHVRNGKDYPDEDRENSFSPSQEAVAHAAVFAAELAQDGDWDGFMISVTDADGRIIARDPRDQVGIGISRELVAPAEIHRPIENIAVIDGHQCASAVCGALCRHAWPADVSRTISALAPDLAASQREGQHEQEAVMTTIRAGDPSRTFAPGMRPSDA